MQQRSGYADAAFVSFGKSFAFPVDDFVQLQLLGQGYQIVHKILMADPAQTGHKPQVFVNRHLGIKCPAFGNISDPGQCLQAFAVNVITV